LTYNISAKYIDIVVTFINSINGTCNFPNPAVGVTWTVTFDPVGCVYIMQVQIPWIDAFPGCIFNRTDTGSELIFEGIADFIFEEVLNDIVLPDQNIQLTRNFSQPIPFEVVFPKSITLQATNITIFADVIVDAAIVQQTFNPLNLPFPGLGYIELFTVTLWPFKLVPPFSITGNGAKFLMNISANAQDGVTTCLNNGQNCEQYWDIYLQPLAGVCDLDGTFNFSFGFGCSDAFENNCPLTGSNSTGVITFIIASEFLCPVVVDTVDLAGSLVTYQDAQHTSTKVNFLVDQTIYFVALVSSTKVSIVNSTVAQFLVQYSNGTSIVLYQNGANTAYGNTADLVITSVPPVENDISIELIPALFAPNNGMSDSYIFVITIDVTYLNTQKRSIVTVYAVSQQTGSSSYNDQTAVVVDSVPTPVNTNPSPNSIPVTHTAGGSAITSSLMIVLCVMIAKMFNF